MLAAHNSAQRSCVSSAHKSCVGIARKRTGGCPVPAAHKIGLCQHGMKEDRRLPCVSIVQKSCVNKRAVSASYKRDVSTKELCQNRTKELCQHRTKELCQHCTKELYQHRTNEDRRLHCASSAQKRTGHNTVPCW